MAKFVRYSLAAVCFAASVGCLALWWRSCTCADGLWGPSFVSPSHVVILEAFDGLAYASIAERSPNAVAVGFGVDWQRYSLDAGGIGPRQKDVARLRNRYGTIHFSVIPATAYCPLWYPALIVALAGVVALRFRRQFSLRSALVATTAIAALIAMAVIL